MGITKLIFSLVGFLSAFLLFYQLNATYLVSFDEAFYGVMAKEMARTGAFWRITFDGGSFFGASPLYIWLEALLFRLFGASELGARFFAALSSLGTTILVYWWFARRKEYVAGVVASLVVVSTVKFLYLGRTGNLDATLTFFTTASLLLFNVGTRTPWFMLFAGLLSGCAFLTKGLFGLWPVSSAALYLAVAQPERLRNLYQAFIGLLVVALPWQILQIAQYGDAYVHGYFFGYMGGKVGQLPTAERLWWVGELLQGLKLWLPVSLVGIVWKALLRRNVSHDGLFLCAVGTYVAAMAMMKTHFDWYLLPLYPVLALITGQVVGALSLRGQTACLLLAIPITLFHLTRYYSSYMVPQTTDAQVFMLRQAELESPSGTAILLDDYYFPVAMFYANRPINRLRANRDVTAAIDADTLNNHFFNGSVLLTNVYTEDSVKRVSRYPLELVRSHGELLLYRPVLQ